jgi:hypothetical protein|tara:strand:+ start:23 stop:226 length:204 start_codon:yes stop_codon:yes gene_type:complete
MPRITHENNQYVPGTYWRECDVCGWDYLRKDLMRRYDNAIVCKDDWEEEHPNDKVKFIRREKEIVRD